jgi:uncharacterized protein (DUF1330 family)
MMNAIIKFPSEQAALSCYNDPEYSEIKKIRLRSASNITMVLVKGRDLIIQDSPSGIPTK